MLTSGLTFNTYNPPSLTAAIIIDTLEKLFALNIESASDQQEMEKFKNILVLNYNSLQDAQNRLNPKQTSLEEILTISATLNDFRDIKEKIILFKEKIILFAKDKFKSNLEKVKSDRSISREKLLNILDKFEIDNPLGTALQLWETCLKIPENFRQKGSLYEAALGIIAEILIGKGKIKPFPEHCPVKNKTSIIETAYKENDIFQPKSTPSPKGSIVSPINFLLTPILDPINIITKWKDARTAANALLIEANKQQISREIIPDLIRKLWEIMQQQIPVGRRNNSQFYNALSRKIYDLLVHSELVKKEILHQKKFSRDIREFVEAYCRAKFPDANQGKSSVIETFFCTPALTLEEQKAYLPPAALSINTDEVGSIYHALDDTPATAPAPTQRD